MFKLQGVWDLAFRAGEFRVLGSGSLEGHCRVWGFSGGAIQALELRVVYRV